MNQFNHILMCYTRSSLKQAYLAQDDSIDPTTILLTEPRDLDFELMCLARYRDIVSHVLKQLEAETTMQEDVDLLGTSKDLNDKQRFAVIYRSERKKIVHNQLDLIKWLSHLVSEALTHLQSTADTLGH